MIAGMELQPSEPPGRANRKLRAYVSEIARLRDEGYTIEAIRKTLSDAGIKVGWTTVQREAARASKQPAKAAQATAERGRIPEPRSEAQTASPTPTPAPSVNKMANEKPKMGAEQFFAQHVDNPLIRKRKP